MFSDPAEERGRAGGTTSELVLVTQWSHREANHGPKIASDQYGK